jgi:hypothetical protein
MNFYFLPKPQRLRHAWFKRRGGDLMDCETQDDRTAVAEYVCDLTAELAVMAAWAEHIDLARLLEMARLESEHLCGRASDVADLETDGAAAVQESAGQIHSGNVILLSARRAAGS